MLAGCYSMDIATTDALQNSALSSRDGKVLEHVVVSNYGWYLFDSVPLVCGNPDSSSCWAWTFFDDEVTTEAVQGPHGRNGLLSYPMGSSTF